MKAAWEQLGDEYQDSSSVVVGDVDCTVHQDLCSKHGVSGYPTIKYWKDGTANAYNGGRDFDGLQKFTKDNLVVLCNVATMAECSDKEKAFITQMKEKPEKIEEQYARLQKMSDSKAAPALKQWLNQRLNILKQLTAKKA